MTTPADDAITRSTAPVFGFVLFGGPLSGALVRDIRLANNLADRGFAVHVWWAMDRQRTPALRPNIQQHWLFHSFRYLFNRRSGHRDRIGRALTAVFRDKNRSRTAQARPWLLDALMRGMIHRVCEGVETDPALVRRFARQINEAGVTHLLPMLGVLCPWAAAAAKRAGPHVHYLVTFQGYELYVNYARAMNREREVYQRLVEVVDGSSFPAIAVSSDYAERVAEDIGVNRDRLRAIPPGVPTKIAIERGEAPALIEGKFPEYRPDVPLVSYLGRRDTEKGLDLLLYAVSMLRRDGLDLQLAICGPTLFGQSYAAVCHQIAQDLRCRVFWSNHISNELRSALFIASRCVVYPSIHREPFGMVPVEALAHGTPVVVPDYGGIADAIGANGEIGGLHFQTWDSADLAAQMARIVKDDDLHRRLSDTGPRVASYYSVPNLADRVLDHLGLPHDPAG